MPEILLLVGGAEVAAAPGDTILSAMKRAGRSIQSVCGGRGMCGTCRVAIDPSWLDRLPPSAFAETRLLRVLRAGTEHHRLACQTILSAEHDGLAFAPDPPPIRMLQTLKQETMT